MAADPRIGTELSGYRIEELIGRGGMGVVYRAFDPALERPVALKLIKPELAEDERFRARFLRESRIAASIDHSHIVPIHDAGEWEGELYIAMRYVEGTDLKELLRDEGPLEPSRTLAILSQASSALDAAHARGLVHRDVKPANILITAEAGREEHVYLSDFGLSKPASSQEEGMASVQLSGSSDYAAPEQIEGKTVDQQTDVYALGCVLYECLSGEPPFRSSSPVGVLFGHLNSPPPSLTGRKPALAAAIDPVVAKALAKEPEERYESCSALIKAAGAVLHPEPGILDRIGRRGIAALALLGALILAAAIVPTLLLTGGGEAGGTTEITEPSLQKIDPETNELVETIELNAIPDDMAVGAGGVWLLDRQNRALTQLDPETNEAVGTVGLEQTGQIPNQIAIAEDAVLLSFTVAPGILEPGSSIWTYDPDRALLSLTAESDIGTTISDFLGAFGELWIADNELTRVRSDDGGPATVIPLVADDQVEAAYAPFRILADESTIWVLSGFERPGSTVVDRRSFMLWHVDPSQASVIANFELPGDKYDLALGAGSVWVSIGSDDEVQRVNPSTGQLRPVTVGRNPVAISFGEGAAWVANARDGTVSRIDPQTLDVDTIKVGGIPSGLAAGDGAVWVAVQPS